MTKDDSVKPLDNSGPLSPPNNVTAKVTVNGTTNSHVFLSEATGGVINQTQYTCATGNNLGDPDFVINEAIAGDTPTSGWILIKEGTTFEPIEYSSWTSSTFTLVGTLGQNYTSGKNVIIPILYDNIATDGGFHTANLVQSTDIPVAGWVRQGTPAAPGKPVAISGTIGAAGLALTVTIESE